MASVSPITAPDRPSLPRAAGRASLPEDLGSTEFRSFYRWGWLPLVVGGLALSAVVIFGFEALLASRGISVSREIQLVYGGRAFVTAFVMALWSGLFVHRTRRRIEATREALRAERARLVEQRRRLEQTAGVAAILRVMAHELRNPLNGMILHCRVIERTLRLHGDPEGIGASVEVVESEAKRLAALVDEYVALGRARDASAELRPVDVRDPIREVFAVHEPSLARRGIRLVLDVPRAPLVVDGDRDRLAQLLHNLVRNAGEALRDHGTIRVTAARDDGAAILTVTDDGPGFADTNAVFRPFYTTKAEGTGLGLAIVWDLVRAHRGTVEAENVAPHGARVRIRLPLRGPECTA